MKNHLRECALRSGCHLLPANSTHPDNKKKARNTAQTAKLCALTWVLTLQIIYCRSLKGGWHYVCTRHWPFICLHVGPCHAALLSDLLCSFGWQIWLKLRLHLGKSKCHYWTVIQVRREYRQKTHKTDKVCEVKREVKRVWKRNHSPPRGVLCII